MLLGSRSCTFLPRSGGGYCVLLIDLAVVTSDLLIEKLSGIELKLVGR